MATLSSLLPSIYHQPRALSDQISLVTSDVNFPGTQENSISRNLISFAGHFSPTCTSASRSCPFVPILSQSNSSPIFISPDSTSTSSSSFGLGYSSVSNCSACCKQLRASASPPAFSRPLTSFSCFRKSSSPFPVRPPSISHSRYCILTFAKNQSRPRPNSQAAEDTGSFHRNTLRETATNVASELLKNVKRSDASSVSEPNVTAEAASLSPLQPAGTAIANFQRPDSAARSGFAEKGRQEVAFGILATSVASRLLGSIERSRRNSGSDNVLKRETEVSLIASAGSAAVWEVGIGVDAETAEMDGVKDKEFTVLFVEMGVGYDQHGQNITTAAVRACKAAISSNSIPAFRTGAIPGVSWQQMKLKVVLGVPHSVQGELNLDEVKKVFPYGEIIRVEVVDGGLICSSGGTLEAMGDKNDDCYVVNAAIYVGY
eukprot:TRINITY_DN7638_c0_g1_i5.p1 TRINITY_DN7638_c0_g1~~TRINITY_DN7638_c0_g1_i5.p1  ORF type:complete len:447 (+),score=43.18 TRINITY_DN7638_c0_g1_i5:49-1341(+)